MSSFETETDDWNLNYKDAPGIFGRVYRDDLENASTSLSKKYLAIRFQTNGGHGVKIRPKNPIEINGYVTQVQFYLFGFKEPHELYGDIEDKNGTIHRLLLQRTNFKGWKKITLTLDSSVKQKPTSWTNQSGGIKFLGFYLQPAQLNSYCELYIDDLSATVYPYNKGPKLPWDRLKPETEN